MAILSFGRFIFGIGGYWMGLVALAKPLSATHIRGLLLALVMPSIAVDVLGRLLHGRGLAGAYFAIVTLCAAIIVETLAQQWSFIGGFNGLPGTPPSYHGDRCRCLMSADRDLPPYACASLAVFLVLSYIIWSPVDGAGRSAIMTSARRSSMILSATRSEVVVSAWHPTSQKRCSKQFGFAAHH
jgi:branched-chain amino acid transport system permease protein/urea transport system permease protein